MKRDFLGVVLCGGQSRRLGMDKAELEIRPGVRQIDYALELLENLCQRLAVSVGPTGNVARRTRPDVENLVDAESAQGPLAGILAALRAAEGRPVLAVACDMPYLEASHLVQLANRRNPERLATAFRGSDGLPDPMCAIYEPVCLGCLEARTKKGWMSLRRFLEAEPVELVDPVEGEFLASVNDRDALAVARRRLGGG